MASTMYHNAGATLLGSDGVYRFVCDGPGCFAQTFQACAALCAVFGVASSVILLAWVTRERRRAAARAAAARKGYPIESGGPVGTSQSLADAMIDANLMGSMVEFDMRDLHDDGDADSGAAEVARAVGAAASAVTHRARALAGSARNVTTTAHGAAHA